MNQYRIQKISRIQLLLKSVFYFLFFSPKIADFSNIYIFLLWHTIESFTSNQKIIKKMEEIN